MATPSDINEAFNEILDVGREKLSEGNFLKLATLLQNIHKEQTRTESEIVLTRIIPVNIRVEFDTHNGKHCVVVIDSHKTEYMRGSTPNREYVSGTLNGISFTDRDEVEFITYLERFKRFYGMKNIVRKMDIYDEETFTTFGKFRKYMREREADDMCDSDDEDDGGCYQDAWVIRNIFGLT